MGDSPARNQKRIIYLEMGDSPAGGEGTLDGRARQLCLMQQPHTHTTHTRTHAHTTHTHTHTHTHHTTHTHIHTTHNTHTHKHTNTHTAQTLASYASVVQWSGLQPMPDQLLEIRIALATNARPTFRST